MAAGNEYLILNTEKFDRFRVYMFCGISKYFNGNQCVQNPDAFFNLGELKNRKSGRRNLDQFTGIWDEIDIKTNLDDGSGEQTDAISVDFNQVPLRYSVF